MRIRFGKRIKLAPGLHLNLSGKRGASLTVGAPGASVNVGLDGKRRTTLSLPGTGLSHVTEHTPRTTPAPSPAPRIHARPARPAWRRPRLTGLLYAALAAVWVAIIVVAFR